MEVATQPQFSLPRQAPRPIVALKGTAVASGGAGRSAASSDYPKIILIGEPGSGWRAAFDIIPGSRIMVGRPTHVSKNFNAVAHLPSRAVSRMHAIISIEPDGKVYLTHTKATNLTWREVDSVWTPMRPGDRAPLQHTDTLCFGMAPKTKFVPGKLDTPFLISIAFASKGESIHRFHFVHKAIHRPAPSASKSRDLDPAMKLLMDGLDGLNVALDNASAAPPKEDDEVAQMGKRKRGSAELEEPELALAALSVSAQATPTNTTKSTTTSSSTSATRSTRPLRTSLNGKAKLPTARSVFGLVPPPKRETVDGNNAEELSEQMQNLNAFENAPRKRRVLDEPGRVYCDDAEAAPVSQVTNDYNALSSRYTKSHLFLGQQSCDIEEPFSSQLGSFTLQHSIADCARWILSSEQEECAPKLLELDSNFDNSISGRSLVGFGVLGLNIGTADFAGVYATMVMGSFPAFWCNQKQKADSGG
ncbi:hypothetical protein DL93DRAFT_2095842 [Clavulina sp. PMI_390]|nr:hypothetical protein DL93DRAFT_2095842 [Clavulina sp. PMI_390]